MAQRGRMLGQRGQRSGDHPAVDGGHDAVALCRGYERGWRDDLALLVAQPQQHLEMQAALAIGLQRCNALCVQAKALLLQRRAYARDPFHLADVAGVFAVVAAVDIDAVAAALLGAVAGHVGHAQQVLGRLDLAADVDQSNAQSCAQHLLAPVHVQGFGSLAQLFGNAQRGLGRTVLQKNAEFVAAQAGQGVCLTQVVQQQTADLAQHFIARRMAAGLVDELELVQIHVQQGCGPQPVLALVEQALQAALEFHAVLQPGQAVMAGMPGKLVQILLLTRDIPEHDHRTCRALPAAADGRAHELDRHDAAVMAPQPPRVLFAQLPTRQQMGQQAFRRLGGVDAVEMQALGQVPSLELLLAAAQQAQRGRVGIVHHALGVRGDHGIAQRCQRGLGPFLFGQQVVLHLLALLQHAPRMPERHQDQRHAQHQVNALQPHHHLPGAATQRGAELLGGGCDAGVDLLDLALPGDDVLGAHASHGVALLYLLRQPVELLQVLVALLPVTIGLLQQFDMAKSLHQPDQRVGIVRVVASQQNAGARVLDPGRHIVQRHAGLPVACRNDHGLLEARQVARRAAVHIAAQGVDGILLCLGPQAFSGHEGAHRRHKVEAAAGHDHQHHDHQHQGPDALHQLQYRHMGWGLALHRRWTEGGPGGGLRRWRRCAAGQALSG